METQKALVEEFVDALKESYRERQLNCEEQWPPVSTDKLVNLQLVEAEKKEGFRAGLPQHGTLNDDKVKRTPILHGDLFKVEEGKKSVRKLIIEGNAGMGKTTLCTMLAEEWAEDKILTQFDCVLVLPLRDQLVASASSLEDLLGLYHPDKSICSSVAQQLKRTRGKGVLIIADGWDELSKEKRSEGSFIYRILFGRLLPSATVLLTSRPTASAPLHNLSSVNRLVEVVGFNEENVKQYIKSQFDPEKASSLIEQLENNPVIESVCSVPLNCAIICSLWDTLRGVLPSTLTELYTQIVLNIILRNLRKIGFLDCPISLSNFDSIPNNLQDLFWLTCKFAYDCLSQHQIVFPQNELFPEILDSSSKFLCFGLLQSARSLLPVGQSLSFHFVHLTIQEFLAALHFVTLPNEKKLVVCEAHASSDRFAMVWRFVFGFGCKRGGSYSRRVICLDARVVDRFVSRAPKKLSSFGNKKLLLCQCSFESLNISVYTKIAEKIGGFLVAIAGSPYDCISVFHVLRHTSHCVDVRIKLESCNLNDKLIKELTGILSSAGDKLQVRELLLRNNKLTDKSVTDLLSRASASFSTLESLSLDGNRITNFKPLISSFNNLTYLDLSNNPLGVSGVHLLETAVQAGVLFNLWLLPLSNTLTDDADVNGALLTTFLPAIASHCPHLCKFDLSKNNLGVPGACALGGAFSLLQSGKNRLEFVLSETSIDSEAAVAFTDVYTASIVKKKSSCSCELDFSTNPLGHNGLLAIFQMLRNKFCAIVKLFLGNTDPVYIEPNHCNQLASTREALSLGSAIESSRLKILNLNDNNLSGDKVHFLAECVRVCTSLECVNCLRCSLTSSEVINFLDILKSNGTSHKNLRYWDLWSNFVDDEGVTALIESLPELLPSLEYVELSDNPVSDEVEDKLLSLLEVNRRKRVLRDDAEREFRRCAVLTEWKRTCLPPQSEELLLVFNKMWSELLEEIVYRILDMPSVQDGLSLIQLEMAASNDVTARHGLQTPLELSPPTKTSLKSSSCEDSTTEDSPTPPSDDKSFHSATEELDEPVRAHLTASDESISPIVQSPHRIEQQETMIMSGGGMTDETTPPQTTPSSSNGMANVTKPPQTTHSTHSTLPGVCGLKTVTIEELKTRTKVTDSQLDCPIQERDLFKLSAHFDNVESYLVHLGLTPSQRTDIEDLCTKRGTQVAISRALRLWREPNPYAATYRALVEVLLDLGKGEVAVGVFTYLSSQSLCK